MSYTLLFVMISSLLQRFRHLPDGKAENLLNALLLCAVSQGCVEDTKTVVKSMYQDKRSKELKMPSFLDAVTKPLRHCGGINWRTNNHVDGSETGEKQTVYEYRETAKMYNFTLPCSPNFLSLFLETYASPKSGSAVLMSPRVNHRNLHIKRLWGATPTSKDPGVISTMLGLRVGEIIRDSSLTDLAYHIFPYKITELPKKDDEGPSTSTSDSGLVLSEGVFSRGKDIKYSCRIVTHITVEDVQELLNVLSSKVCTKAYVSS